MSAGVSIRAGSFLLARGRGQGYQLLLVPDFVAAAGSQHQLLNSVAPQPDQPPAQLTYVDNHGQRLTVVYGSRTLVPADLAGPGTAHDEHGRPLVLVFGFVAEAEPISNVDDADLNRAWDEAIGVYRAFLADEARFTPVQSASRPLRSPGTPTTRPTPRPPGRPLWITVGVPAVVVVVVLVIVVAAVALLRPGGPTTVQVSDAGTGAYLTSAPCVSSGCPRIADVGGQSVTVICQVKGDPVTDTPVAAAADPRGTTTPISSTRWYGVDWAGETTAYLPEVWVVADQRGGHRLPDCALPAAAVRLSTG